MLNWIKSMFKKYRELIAYAFFGVLTTLVDAGTFTLLGLLVFKERYIEINNIISQIIAILFAYFTNRKWVFLSKALTKKDVAVEFFSFIQARVFTLLLSLGMVSLFVRVFNFDQFIVKYVSTVVVIILNYILSKLYVFRERKPKNKENAM